METPATYYGYDEKQNCIVSATAEDATNYINPTEVQQKIENLQQVFEEQMNKIVSNLTKIGDDAGQAVIIQGAKMTSAIEEASTVIKQLPQKALGDVDSLTEAAKEAKDTIQRARNEEARQRVASHAGVVQVR